MDEINLLKKFNLKMKKSPDISKKVLDQYSTYASASLLFREISQMKKNSKIKYIFVIKTASLYNLINFFPKQESFLIFSGLRSFLKHLFSGFNCMINLRIYKYILELIKDDSSKGLDRVSEKLRNNLKKINPKYIFLETDIWPYERLLISISKELGIKVVIVQHGIFTDGLHDGDGETADIFLSYDAYSSQIIKAINNNVNTIEVGSLSKNLLKKKFLKRRVVCFIGQPIPLIFPEYKKNYLSLISSLDSKFCDLGVNFFYKPHPAESQEEYLKYIKNKTKLDSENCFARFDYFLSLTSSLSFEASLLGKVSAMIETNWLNSNISKSQYCHFIKEEDLLNNTNELFNLLPRKSNNLKNYNKGNLEDRLNYLAAELSKIHG
tara:strand:- start:205 stop:1344 length:1140 start_codon:yes stop_codon:yes gene_type:complete